MARRDALLRLNKTLTARRNELRKRLGAELGALGSQQLKARELNQIERALLRLKQGTYGVCEGCGAKIPVARLNVLPYSTLCIKCQRASENDSDWLAERRNANWEAVSDGSSMDDREVRLSDLEMDYSK